MNLSFQFTINWNVTSIWSSTVYLCRKGRRMAKPFCRQPGPQCLPYQLLLSVSLLYLNLNPCSLSLRPKQLPNSFFLSVLLSTFHFHADARMIYLKQKFDCSSLFLGPIQQLLIGLRIWIQFFSGAQRLSTLCPCFPLQPHLLLLQTYRAC